MQGSLNGRGETVEQEKGGKDRHAMLSPQLLELLGDMTGIARAA